MNLEELRHEVYMKLYPITKVPAQKILENDISRSDDFYVESTHKCIVGWAYGMSDKYSFIDNPEYCKTCTDLSVDIMESKANNNKPNEPFLNKTLEFIDHFYTNHRNLIS